MAHTHFPQDPCSGLQLAPDPPPYRSYASEASGPPEGIPDSSLPLPSHGSLSHECPRQSLTSKSQPCQGLVNGVRLWLPAQRRAKGAHDLTSGLSPWDLSLEVQDSGGLGRAPEGVTTTALLFDPERRCPARDSASNSAEHSGEDSMYCSGE